MFATRSRALNEGAHVQIELVPALAVHHEMPIAILKSLSYSSSQVPRGVTTWWFGRNGKTGGMTVMSAADAIRSSPDEGEVFVG